MGRLIDIDVLFDYFGNDAIDKITRSNIEHFVSEKGTVEAIPKADYENRLATDMATIKQLSNSVKTLQRANLEIAGAYGKLETDYENRLKADMAAMLEDLKKEIEELRLDKPLMSRGYECYGFEDKTPTEIKEECSDIIQQKIDSLKGEENE